MASLSFTSIAESISAVNISSPARTDWAHWGDGNTSSVTPVNRKSGGGSLISCALYASTPGVSWFDDSARPISWSDGTPTGSSTSNPNGIYDTTNGGGGTSSGGGFTLTFQLSAGSNAIEIYCGSYAGRLTVAASVSDSSSSAISNTTTLDDSGASGMSGYALIECTPGSAGQTLTVNVYANNIYSGYGNTTVSGAAITQSGGGGGTSLTPAQDAFVLTGPAPTLTRTANQSLSPAHDALVLTGFAPTLTQGAGLTLTPGQDAIALSGLAPTLAQSANQALAPGQDALALTGLAPTLARTANQALVPAADAVVLTGFAPSVVQASASVSLAPGSASMAVIGWAPTFVQTGSNPYPPGSGGGPLAYFPSQASIREQARREETERWIKAEQAKTRRLEEAKRPKPQPVVKAAPFKPEPPAPIARPKKDTRIVAARVKAAAKKRREERAIAQALRLLLD